MSEVPYGKLILLSLVLTGLGTPAFAGLASAQPTQEHFVNPVAAYIYVNGFYPYSGVFNYTLRPGAQVTLNLTATYPWSSYPSATASIPVKYAFMSYPLSTAMPTWISPSSATPGTVMARGTSTSTTMQVRLSSSAPVGQTGSFAIDAYYTDPVSGENVDFVIIVNVLVSSTAIDVLPSQSVSIPTPPVATVAPDSRPPPPSGSGWFLGGGMCDTSSDSWCGSTGISWGSQNGVELEFNIPSFTDPTAGSTFIVVSSQLGVGNELIQYVFVAPTSGSTWQLQMQFLPTSGTNCMHNTGTVSGSTYSWDETAIYYSTTYGWLAYDIDVGHYYSYSSLCPSFPSPQPTTFSSESQLPFGFESYDTTSSDFSSLFFSGAPIFYTTTNGGSTWTQETHAYSANSGGSNWKYTIGTGYATPTSVLEAGSKQCSSISGQGYDFGWDTNSPLNTCGTNSNDVQLN